MNKLQKSFIVTFFVVVFSITPSHAKPLMSSHLTLSERHKMEEISSIFENSTPVFQYSYIQDIGDGAGITAGRLGFNTDAGDLLDIVQKYTKALSGQSTLKKYIPCLKAYAKTKSYACLFPSVSASVLASDDFKDHGLTDYDFGKAWTQAGKDPAMKKVQDQAVQENVYDEADVWAKKLGIETVFGYAVLFDVVIQQGGGDDTNSMGGMVRRTEIAFSKQNPGEVTPSNVAKESVWLSLFLLERRETLRFGYNDQDIKNTSEVPYESYPRADSLIQILNENNPDLSKPIVFDYFGGHFSIKS